MTMSLFPNQFVNVKLLVDTTRDTLLVPAAAVQRNPQGTFVYVVRPDRTVDVRTVTVGATQGDVVALDSGVTTGRTPGDRRIGQVAGGHQGDCPGGVCSGNAAGGGQGDGAEQRPVNPSRPFILRPVATSLLMAAILLAGVVAYRQLPVSALPEVDYPTIQVLTFYPGASPDVMASSVTSPLERQFGQVPGLKQMTSNSSFGSSVITLQFVLTLNIDVAEQEVQAAINAASTYLPADLPNPPIYSKTNPADAPILTLALTSTELPLTQVEDLADTRLAQKISQVSGVGLVSISGGQKPAVRVQANPTALASYGLSLENLRSAIAAANVDEAKGNFDGPQQAYTIGANDQLLSSADYRPLIVAYHNGAPVRLQDVARVIDDAENRQTGGVDEYRAGGDSERSAAAGRQHHHGRRQGQGAVAAIAELAARIGEGRRADGSHHYDSGFGAGRRVRTAAHDCAGGDGHLSVPAQSVGDDHPERRGSALAGRNLRRDVPARLQPQQPHPDGADDLDRFRGRRRDRDDREHRALYRGR